MAVEDDSIRDPGRWPWPRELQAQLLDKLREGGARVIANTALYLEPESNVSASALQSIADDLQKSPLTQQMPVEIETFGVMLDDSAEIGRASCRERVCQYV